MLRSIRLTNYRGFESYIVNFRPFSLVIGKNSAGKSTIIEALRLLSLTTARLTRRSFTIAPSWTKIPTSRMGTIQTLNELDIDLRCISNYYNDDPSIIEATFDSGVTITCYLKPNESMFVTFRIGELDIVASRQLKDVKCPIINVMPQVSPLTKTESALLETYVNRSQRYPVSRLHFRNQVYYYGEFLEAFRTNIEATWPRLRIKNVERDAKYLNLFVEEDGFPCEIGQMGSGLQVWAQMVWFISRISPDSIVALDEPDVYLHADLQRKLVSLLREHQGQVVLASHSVEIMAECRAHEMLIVDRKKKHSNFADSNSAIQNIIDKLGGVQNIQLARLWGSKKCLFVEGKDMEILRAIARTVNAKSYSRFTNTPNFATNGWSGLYLAQGFASTFRTSNNGNYTVLCILDRDYRTESQILEQKRRSEIDGLNLIVWNKKEIENYLLVPSAIHRLIVKKTKNRNFSHISAEWIRQQILDGCISIKTDTFNAISTSIYDDNRSGGVTSANVMAQQIIDERYSDINGMTTIASGKIVFNYLNTQLQASIAISVSPLEVARELRKNEIDEELVSVINMILQTQR